MPKLYESDENPCPGAALRRSPCTTETQRRSLARFRSRSDLLTRHIQHEDLAPPRCTAGGRLRAS